MPSLLLAEFADSRRFIATARRAQSADYRLIDAYTPLPVEGMQDLLAHRHSRIRVAMFIGGIATATLAYGLEYFSAVVNYPYNSGGRPLDAWPAFMLVPFATGILVAAIQQQCNCRCARSLDRRRHRQAQYAVESRHTIATVRKRIEKSRARDQLRR